MPPLTNARHERFAQALFEGKSIVEAYATAGYVRYRQNAARLLMTNDAVKTRLAELQEEAARAAEISVESICRELDGAIAVAREKGQANAMVSAASLRAKLAGLLVDRAKVELNATINEFDGCDSSMDMANAALEGLTNYRWLPISDQDRAELAAIFEKFATDTKAFLDQVRARPLIKGTNQQVIEAQRPNGLLRREI